MLPLYMNTLQKLKAREKIGFLEDGYLVTRGELTPAMIVDLLETLENAEDNKTVRRWPVPRKTD